MTFGINYSTLSTIHHTAIERTPDERRETIEYAKALFTGPIKGFSELWETVKDPIGNFLYPISELAYDAVIINAGQDHFDPYQNEVSTYVSRDSEAYQEALNRMHLRVEGLKQAGQHFNKDFNKASGPERLEMSLALGTTVLAPGWILKGAQAASAYARLGTLNPPMKFHNVLNDISHPERFFNFQSADIRKIVGPKNFLYVIDEQGTLLIGSQRTSPFLRNGMAVTHIHHPDLARLKPIYAGGDFLVRDGQVITITNKSGHYLPYGDHLKGLVENTFVKNKFPEALGKYKDVSGDFHDLLRWGPITSQAPRITLSPSPIGVAVGSLTAMNHRFSLSNTSSGYSRFYFSSLFNAAWASESSPLLNDRMHIEQVKKVLQEEENSPEDKVKKAKNVEQHIKQMDNPETAMEMLSPSEKRQMKDLAESSQNVFYPKFGDSVNTLVDHLNAIIDPFSLVKATQQRDEATSLGQQALPFLHTAFNIFQFINPKEAQKTSDIIQNGGQVLQGLAGIADVLLEVGIAGIAEVGFSVASGQFLLGFAGLLKIFQGSGEKDNNEAFMKMFYFLSNQISRLHEDLIEGFRTQGIALGIVDSHLLNGVLRIMTLMSQGQMETAILFDQIKRIIYIDNIYIQEVKKLVEIQARYHIQQQILDADWRETRHKVLSQCKSHAVSMSASDFIKAMDQIDFALKKTQQDGIARASEVHMTEHGKVYSLLTHANSRVQGQPRSITDNFRLHVEQNLHLLVSYLSSLSLITEWELPLSCKKSFFGECNRQGFMLQQQAVRFPPQDALYNPAALYDLAEAAQTLLKTYRKTPFYLGVPEEPTRTILSSLSDGIEAIESLFKELANPQLIGRLIDHYISDLEGFSNLIQQFQEHAIIKYYGENILPRLSKELQKNSLALTAMNSQQPGNFFIKTGPNWFGFLWSHWWDEPYRWSPQGWNQLSNKAGSPSFTPNNRINAAKDLYQQSHQQRAEQTYQKRIDEMQTKSALIEERAQIRNPDFRRVVINFILYDNVTLPEWEAIPYQFLNDIMPLTVSKWHLKQLPKAAFAGHALGSGDLQFTWQQFNNSHIQIKAVVQSKTNRLTDITVLFNQTIPLISTAANFGLLESLYYTWFGGKVPTGPCGEFDLDLNRYHVNGYQDYADYCAGKARYDCPTDNWKGCHYPGWRATICFPYTDEATGLLGDASESKPDSFELHPISTLSDSLKAELEAGVKRKTKQIRRQIVSDLSTILSSGTTKSTEADPDMPEDLAAGLIPSYNKLSLNGRVLKMILSLFVNSNDLDVDTSWPNIFEGEDILRELDQYNGHHVFLSTQLKRNAEQLRKLKPNIRKAIREKSIREKPSEQYPFIHFKADFQQYLEEIQNQHLIPNIISESKPQNLYQLSQITPYLAESSIDLQRKLLAINPTLAPYLPAAKEKQLPASQEKSDNTPDPIEKSQTNSADRARAFSFSWPSFSTMYRAASETVAKTIEWVQGKQASSESFFPPRDFTDRQVSTWKERSYETDFVRKPGYSTFLQPLSGCEKLNIVEVMAKLFIIHNLPWNREKPLTLAEKDQLKKMKQEIAELDQFFTDAHEEFQHLEETGLMKNEYAEITKLLKETKEQIRVSLKKGKISSSTKLEIEQGIDYLNKSQFNFLLNDSLNVMEVPDEG